MANEIVVLKLEVDSSGNIKGFKGLEDKAEKSGKKSGDNYSDGFERGLSGILKAGAKIAGALTAVIGTISFAKSIKNAQIQEDAINSLNSALLITGKFSKETSLGIQAFASELQAASKFGDELILENAALIQSLANLDSKGLKRATQASADFASALNIDLRTASSLVGKALTGQTSALTRYGIQVEKGKTQAETLANVLGGLESKFGGSALSKINTFSGAVAQTSNTFGDLLEEIGFLITKQPLVIDGIKLVGKSFSDAIVSVQNFAKSFSILNDLIIPISEFTDVINTFVVAPIEFAANIVRFSFDKIAEGFAALVATIGQGGGLIAKAFSAFGVSNEFTRSLSTFKESSDETFQELATKANESFKSILDFPFSAGLAEKNASILEQIRLLNDNLKTGSEETKNSIVSSTKAASDGVVENLGTLSLGFQSFKIGFDNTAKTIAATQSQLAGQFKAGLVKGISGGIQTIINSVAAGENAFSAFGKFVLSTFGDLAIQMGQTLIAAGLGVKALRGLDPSGAIAAGAGLVALGAVIKSFVGGGGGASAPAATGGGAAASDDFTSRATPLSEPDSIEERDSGPKVQLVVQGDILDSEQTGNRILDILNKNFSDSGGSFNGASFA